MAATAVSASTVSSVASTTAAAAAASASSGGGGGRRAATHLDRSARLVFPFLYLVFLACFFAKFGQDF